MADIKVGLKLDNSGFKDGVKASSESVDALKKNLASTKDSVTKGLGGAFADLKGKMGGVLDNVFSLKGALGALAGAFAVGKIIDAALEADKAINGVAQSLARSGEFSQSALDDVSAFAGKLQDLTGLGDDTTLAMFSLAQSFGLSKEEAKKVVTAANDLAAATGQDLNSAVTQLSASFNGQIGKLAKLNPALKNLTDEQLAAGAAAEILGKQFAGAAAGQLQTFGGALEAAKGRFGDVLESVGQLITQSPAMIELVRAAEGAFKFLIEAVSANSTAIKAFVKDGLASLISGFSTLAKGLSNALEIFQFLFNVLTTIETTFLDLLEAFYSLEFVQKIVAGVLNAFSLLGEQLADLLSKLARVPGVATALGTLGLNADDVADAFAGMSQAAKEFGDSVTGTEYADALKSLKEKAQGVKDVGNTIFDGAQQGLIDAGVKADELAKKLKTLPTDLTIGLNVKNNANGPTDPRDRVPLKDYSPGTGKDSFVGPPEPSKDPGPSTVGMGDIPGFQDVLMQAGEDIGKAGAIAIAANILQGKEGARKFLSQASAAVADYFAPGLGAVVGPLVDALSQGPEFVKAQVEAFAEALPEFIDAIVEAIPVFIETLADKAPDIIVALANGAPRVAAAIAIALLDPNIWIQVAGALADAAAQGLSYQIGQLAQAGYKAGADIRAGAGQFAEYFKTELPKKLKESFSEVGRAVTDAFKSIGTGLPAALRDAAKQFIDRLLAGAQEFLDKITPGGKGGSGAVPFKNKPTATNPLGFATGGMVVGAGNRDSVPALLSPGELVVDRTTGPRLNAFMDSFANGSVNRQTSADESVTTVLLAKVLELLQQPMTVQTTAEIDGRSLADIILTLNRANARFA